MRQDLNFDRDATPKVLQLYLELAQYPILGKRILQRMRDEVFTRGVISPRNFEEEVREKAVISQIREGLSNPIEQEPADTWNERMEHIRDLVTVFYFAHNLPHDLFQQIVKELVSQRQPDKEVILAFNPELAPWSLLFEQGEIYESYPPEERKQFYHHLREIVVVLTKTLVSDHLPFIRVAREYFTVEDLKQIRAHRIGRGKIGGKAAGMLLAYKILQREGAARGIDVEQYIKMPDSYYLGADAYYDFKSSNEMFRFMNQKYKSAEQIKAEYSQVRAVYLSSHLPTYVEQRLRRLLDQVENSPLIVRSSSLLEDNFDTSFAGKYDSYFLPNQGTPEENLKALTEAIIKVYSSVISPDALIYRQQMGLIDYDERMGILIQKVEGQRYGRYFFPAFAGVGLSYNPFRWSKRIQRKAGLLRMVTGLGTRAVDRVASDYPRMVALSHPELRPESSTSMQRHYSQHLMDVIDMEENAVKTVSIHEVFGADYEGLAGIVSMDRGGYLEPIRGRILDLDPRQMVVTFDRMLTQGPFAELMRSAMEILETAYQHPVDMEFAGCFMSTYPTPEPRISILQCRPQSRREMDIAVKLPENLSKDDILFTANQQVPSGYINNIRYVVYVDPRQYFTLTDTDSRIKIGNLVGQINQRLAGETFILMGPGRWGSSNIQLGVKVTYTDIYHTRALIEVAYSDGGSTPEVSFGTHFFQDLVEAKIYPLPIYPDDPTIIFKEAFFLETPNRLTDLLPEAAPYDPYVRVIDVPAVCEGRTLMLVMDGQEEKAVAYLTNSHEEPGRTM